MDELPIVRFLFPCEAAIYDLAVHHWTLANPLHTVWFPTGTPQDFLWEEGWVFALLTNGRGSFDLGVEVCRYDPIRSTPYVLGRSEPERRTFDDPLVVPEVVFKLTDVPFPTAGQYEFRLTARGQVLENGVANLDVLGEA